MDEDDIENEGIQEDQEKNTFEYVFTSTELLPETKHTKALRQKQQEELKRAQDQLKQV